MKSTPSRRPLRPGPAPSPTTLSPTSMSTSGRRSRIGAELLHALRRRRLPHVLDRRTRPRIPDGLLRAAGPGTEGTRRGRPAGLLDPPPRRVLGGRMNVAERMIEANGVELCTEPFGRFVSTARVDWSDHDSVIDYLVDY